MLNPDRMALRFLRTLHPVPALPRLGTRQTFTPDVLPRVVAFHLADGARSWPTFETTDGRRHALPIGLDAVILEEADGSRAVIFTGHRGRLDFAGVVQATVPGFRVPAALWPAFTAVLSGEDKDLSFFSGVFQGQS